TAGSALRFATVKSALVMTSPRCTSSVRASTSWVVFMVLTTQAVARPPRAIKANAMAYLAGLLRSLGGPLGPRRGRCCCWSVASAGLRVVGADMTRLIGGVGGQVLGECDGDQVAAG